MTAAFLGVEKSCTNKKWVARAYDERMALALSQRFSLPDVIAKSLSARGMDIESAPYFLDPKLRELMPDPSGFKDMDKAAERLVKAIKQNEKVAVIGDYDVDGATSSALLFRFMKAVGRDLRIYIPDRINEGYGPNVVAMQTLAGEGVKLVICVDCGTSSYEPIKAANDLGMEVIVIDHHAAEIVLPEACAVVNPNRCDEEMGEKFGNLAAVGVTYLFVVAVNRALRAVGYFSGNREPDLLKWLDLVALGTVCDVVKLIGLNRAYVTQGLKAMGARQNAGLAALAQVAGVKGLYDTYTAGYILGPRINAGGRVGKSDLGTLLLACDDPVEAGSYASILENHNEERRNIEAKVIAEAEVMTFTNDAPIIFVASENWHAGVLGIVASRLKEKYHRPAIVVGIEGDIARGSSRSIGNIDLGAAIIAARQADLLINGGGHKMAAGFTVAKDKIKELENFLIERIGKQLEAEPFIPTLSVDGLVSIGALNEEFIEKLSALAPYGIGNPEPRFAVADCRIVRATVVGEKHVSLIVTQGNAKLRAIAFRAMENNLGPALLSAGGKNCHLAGHVRPDNWNGNGAVQMIVDDALVSA